jgi:formylglycine-generating enzyme required for sulfatase activity
LPTEAEWEYAIRGGTQGEYFFDDGIANIMKADLARYAWFDKNSGKSWFFGGGTTHPVGQKEPNPWGLYDIYGNVWEWVQDRYGGYPTDQEIIDPQGSVEGSYRVYRGGSWRSSAGSCRSASRVSNLPDHRDYNLGFRQALSPGQ